MSFIILHTTKLRLQRSIKIMIQVGFSVKLVSKLYSVLRKVCANYVASSTTISENDLKNLAANFFAVLWIKRLPN